MLTFFGAGAVAAMLVCSLLEARSSWFVFAFGLACFGASAYGWLTGAWPFGVIEALWGALALRRWVGRIWRTTPQAPGDERRREHDSGSSYLPGRAPCGPVS
jgi:hypothetical protein